MSRGARGVRASAAVVLAGALVAVATPARADFGGDPGGGTPNLWSIESHVTLTVTDPGSGAKNLLSVGGSWVPPACWYEPTYTPEQFDAAFQAVLAGMAGTSGGADALKQYEALKADGDFHKGVPGAWWGMVKTKKSWDLPVTDSCTQSPGIQWVPAGSAPAGRLAVTPQMLSKIAYAATKLPAPQVKLSPAADRQTVNLPTYVSFSQPLQPVSVTASLDYLGFSIAASTLAVPVALRVDAGTDDASPRSCTYNFVASGGGYQVDSSTSDCNITYDRSSRGGSYPLTGQVTWKVTWTPSKDPHAAPANPLPNGLTDGTPQNVTVREIQTVVTG
ncbi:hypothetical protein ABT095_14760 [Kitasatospora sp. NPDC002227]|uniref:hypothetical protein n=1 Tax=Kitasatospora sp. NPDC002227 TaxID=3154773 RepID=UPI00332E4CCA